MSAVPPPHYRAFRLVLVAVIAAALVGAVWVVTRPPVWAVLLDYLGLV